MRRIMFLLILNVCWLAAIAQSVDLMNVYTDKDNYLAGEELWVKVVLNDGVLQGNELSRVAYVEICDTAQVCAQGKIALSDGMGWACIRLPQTMHSGVYQLTAYTRYMRNLASDCFPRKYLAVLNTLTVSENDDWGLDASSSLKKTKVFDAALMKGDKNCYGLRDKVSLTWPSDWANAEDLTLSVVRKDCEVGFPEPEVASPSLGGGKRWLPECEGHIVAAKLESDVSSERILTQMSCVGKEMKVFEGMKEDEGIYHFHTYGVTGKQDVVLSALSSEGQAYRMGFLTPFAELLPERLPAMACRYQDSALIDRSVALQLNQAMPKAALPKEMEQVIYGQLPSKTYNLDEYVRFNTVQECIVEFVLGVTTDKQGDRTVIRMLQEDRDDYNMFPVLVLVDGVAFYNHSEVLEYNAHQVQYIHQYRGNYVLGETFYGGILSLVTHRGTMPDMRINSDMQMFSYEFPQERPCFDAPVYDDEESKASRRPDFRHTLHWEPLAKGKQGVTFYTSDLPGTYVAVLQGRGEKGEKIEACWEFEVKE